MRVPCITDVDRSKGVAQAHKTRVALRWPLRFGRAEMVKRMWSRAGSVLDQVCWIIENQMTGLARLIDVTAELEQLV